jgi:outer membrane lipoprotein-sorting protein
MKNKKTVVIACAFIVSLTLFPAAPWLEAQAQGAPDAKKRGSEILAEGAAATGGDSLKKIESLAITMAGNAHTPTGPIPIDVKLLVAYPNRSRLETNFEMGSVTSAFDGKSGWFSSPQGGVSDLPADLNPETLRSIDLVGGVGLFKKTLAGKAEAEFSGEKEISGQKALQIEWNGPSGRIRIYFDRQTKLLIGAKYQVATLQGTFEEERRWSDHRDVEGVRFPFHWITYRDGALYSDLTVKEVKLNEKIDAAMFAKPQ